MKINKKELWEKVSLDGFGEPLNVSVRGIAVFKDRLYVDLMNVWNLQLDSYDKYGGNDKKQNEGINKSSKNWRGFSNRSLISKGCQIYCTDGNEKSKNLLDWKQVVGEDATGENGKSGFGDENNWDASVLIPFKKYLYAGTFNIFNGCEIYRTKDGIDWEPVVGGGAEYIDGGNYGINNLTGFGNSGNWAVWKGIVFKDELYVGTVNWSGCEIYKTKDGLRWEAVVGGDSKYVSSGFGRLFGDNIYAWSMEIFNNELYVGTCSLPKRIALNYLLQQSMNTLERISSFSMPTFFPRGFEIWKTSDSKKWEKVVGGLGIFTEKSSGFGDHDNWGARSMEVFKGKDKKEYLYVGTAVNLYKRGKGSKIYRRDDKGKWEEVFNKEVYHDPHLQYVWAMKSIPIENKLFAGIANSSNNSKRAGQIWSTVDGTTWIRENIGKDWGKSDNRARAMEVFQNQLFVGTYNFLTGCTVWRKKNKK